MGACKNTSIGWQSHHFIEKGKPKMPQRNKMSRQTPLGCPVCRVVCQGPQGLSAHVRSAHPQHFRKYGLDPATASAKEKAVNVVDDMPVIEIEDIPTQAVTVQPAAVSPLDMVDRALATLEERAKAIEAEAARLVALQKEHGEVKARINALRAARQAFEPAVEETAARTAEA